MNPGDKFEIRLTNRKIKDASGAETYGMEILCDLRTAADFPEPFIIGREFIVTGNWPLAASLMRGDKVLYAGPSSTSGNLYVRKRDEEERWEVSNSDVVPADDEAALRKAGFWVGDSKELLRKLQASIAAALTDYSAKMEQKT